MTHSHDTVAVDAARAATQPLTHHGRTTAAWAGSMVTLVGFIIGTVGFLMNISWPVVWAGIVVILLGAVVGGVLRSMGHGAPREG